MGKMCNKMVKKYQWRGTGERDRRRIRRKLIGRQGEDRREKDRKEEGEG